MNKNQILYVSFTAPINQVSTENLIGLIGKKVNEGASDVYLLLSTTGGAVHYGLTLYNTLRALPIHLTTHNMGSVNSIGNAIFLAGEKRYACPASKFMFHGVGMDPSTERLEEKNLTEKLESIKKNQELIQNIICERTNIDPQEAETLFFQQVTKDPDYAKDKGIIDDIQAATIPTGAEFLQLVFK